jgi:hypothetical protein
MTNERNRGRLLATMAVLAAGWAAADTLTLRDGKRVEGTLVGVRGDTIEFERSGWNRRTERFDRRDVRRIEIDAYSDNADNDGSGNSSGNNGGYGDSRPSYGRPSGLRERSVSVMAASAWSDTGVTVRGGQQVYFSASGQVRWGKDRRDGPGGEHNSPRNPGRPIPDRAGAALIGRIDNGDPFLIGSEDGPIRMRSSGRLQLGINDDYLPDNSGDFRVTVYY